MGLKRKQMLMQQKAYFEQKLQDRLSFLSGKGIKSPKSDKDTLVRNLQASIRAVKSRLRLIAENEKKTEKMAEIKAEKAAARRKDQEDGKSEKPKRATEEGKAKIKKKEKEMKEEPEDQAKADK